MNDGRGEKVINFGAFFRKLCYDSPTILTFIIACTVIMMVDRWIANGFARKYFSVGTSVSGVLGWFRIFSHALGHANWEHLHSNIPYIVLLGPTIEEKYGSWKLLLMILLTAGITGLINVIFFSTGLMGASGIVFMLIMLTSDGKYRKGKIQMTFLLLVGFWLGREIINIAQPDNISQMGHIVGGIAGVVLGFWVDRKR